MVGHGIRAIRRTECRGQGDQCGDYRGRQHQCAFEGAPSWESEARRAADQKREENRPHDCHRPARQRMEGTQGLGDRDDGEPGENRPAKDKIAQASVYRG